MQLCVLVFLTISCAFSVSETTINKQWYVFVTQPLELSLRDIFKISNSPQIKFIASMKELLRYTQEFHRDTMKCRTEIDKPQHLHFYGKYQKHMFKPHSGECWETVNTSPCGQIALIAHATFAYCKWFIRTLRTLTINATFIHFDIPRATLNCKHDRVQIGKSGSQSNVKKFCGRRRPFTVIPNFSMLQMEFHIAWRVIVTHQVSRFTMVYQLTQKNVYIMTGKPEHDNIAMDTSILHTFLPGNRIMAIEEINIYSIHFNVHIDYNVHLNVAINSWTDGTVLQAYDGPSISCYMLKKLTTGDNITSFGTSLLLTLHSNSISISNVSILFSRVPRDQQFDDTSTIVATSKQIYLSMLLKVSKYCREKHQIIYCNLGIK